MTGDSSGETCQFRDLALTPVADTVYARPYVYYKKPMYVPKWSISFGIIYGLTTISVIFLSLV